MLAALRGLAGALSDLAEEAAPILQAELRTSDPVGAASTAEGHTEEKPTPSAEENKVDEKHGGDTKKKSKKPKGEKKKPTKRVKGEKKAKEKRKRSRSSSSRRRAEEGEPASSAAGARPEPRPEDLGLRPLPRGSLRRHFEEKRVSAGDRRPPEPPGPPPRAVESSEEREPLQRRPRGTRQHSGATRRGTKGKQHQERSQLRAQNWARWGRQQQWRRRER